MIYNTSGKLQINTLWYDYPKGRNFNIIQRQLGELAYDLEWNNVGTAVPFRPLLGPCLLDSNKKCKTLKFDVGILTPNWLDDGVLWNVWEKVDFIWYYEDVVTKRHVRWVFYTGNFFEHFIVRSIYCFCSAGPMGIEMMPT
ncbi:hypothetical protein MKW94_005949 [Papaver nudicaule]|nr:hypothetical protein [Papaver nudicaule]